MRCQSFGVDRLSINHLSCHWGVDQVMQHFIMIRLDLYFWHCYVRNVSISSITITALYWVYWDVSHLVPKCWSLDVSIICHRGVGQVSCTCKLCSISWWWGQICTFDIVTISQSKLSEIYMLEVWKLWYIRILHAER